MAASTRVVLKAFGTRQVREGGVHSPEELKLIVSASRRLGILAPPQEELIHRALELENISVREIMVPRRDIFSLPGNISLEEALQLVVDEQHSRVPVYDVQRGPEHIVGVLYAKDLMRWLRYRVNRTASGRPVSRPSGLQVRHIMREEATIRFSRYGARAIPNRGEMPRKTMRMIACTRMRKKHSGFWSRSTRS
jgi:CBS domain containing-hemolysin-like protein